MIFTIAAKELRSMFASPLAWVVLAFMQFVLALIFLKQIDGFLVVQGQLARTPNAPGLTEIAIVPIFGVASMVLLMSVNPGFGGQSFIPYVLDKVRKVRGMIDATGLDIRLEIDGGITVENVAEVAAAGVDTFVSGSAIFGSADYRETISRMRANANVSPG